MRSTVEERLLDFLVSGKATRVARLASYETQ